MDQNATRFISLRLPVTALRVATGKGPTLLGRDWLEYLTLDWRHIHNVYSTLSHTVDLEFLLQNYSHVFKDELGAFTGPKASLRVK